MVNILATIDSENYSKLIYNIVQDAENATDNNLYVSLNRTYKSLMMGFEEKSIDAAKFWFIDTITAAVITPEPIERCVFLKDPNDMKALYAAIIKTVKEKNIDMVVFDSLSSLTTYENMNGIIHFVNTLLGSLSLLSCSAVFTCLSSDKDKDLIKQVKMKVDKYMDVK